MTIRLIWLGLCVILGCAVIGCDPARTTSQSVRVRITSTSGRPVVGAKVLLKYDVEIEKTRHPNWLPENHRVMRENWEEAPWLSGVTDSKGETTIDIVTLAVDSTWGTTPPSSRDEVTGVPYLVKVLAGEAKEEQFTITMKAGASATGDPYTVSVVDVNAPRYIPTR